MRILTYNSHQPYIHLLASLLPWDLGVITPRLPSGVVKGWNLRIRPLPANVRLYASAEKALRHKSWDWILAHNANDLIDSREIPLPKAFLVHGTLTGRIVQDRSNIDRNLYIENLTMLLRAADAKTIYISELKKRDWGIPGDVICSAVDVEQYGGYHGSTRGILQVCHHLKERGRMMGYDVYRYVCHGQPSLLLGENPLLSGSRLANSWEDFKDQLRSLRIYLYTARHPYEDGYNLALLEAMATGMPVATLKHATSPIRDGIEGIVASSKEELRERIIGLLNAPDEAARMGKEARIRIQSEFPVRAFRSAWEDLSERLCDSR